MRIALFTDTYPPQLNGVANSTWILRNQLEKHGHDVFVVTTFKGSGRSQWDEEGKVLRLAGMELKFLYGYVMTSPFHMFALEEIRNLNLDVIHVQTEFGVGIFARICAKQLKIPLVSTYHTTYEDYTHYVNFLDSRRVDEIAKKGVAKASKLYGDSSMEVIAPSEKTRQMLLRYHIRREISVIPTGLELESFDPTGFSRERRREVRSEFGFEEDETLIIYVGRLAEEKSLDLVIRGFRKAIDEGVKVKLLIVGGGPDLEPLRKLSSELGLDGQVVLCGPRAKELVPDLYRSADAFVSASLSETQGMTFIEAMASGLPLFARKDEVLDELLFEGETGWYFESEEDLAEKLRAFTELNQADHKRISAACLEKVKPYSAEVFYERVIKVYESTVEAYHHQYVIDDVKVRNNTVQLYLISNQKEELRLQVSMDDYYNMGMRKDGILTSRAVEDLRKREEGTLAYQKCLKKLAVKDRTRKEIYDWLTQNTQCEIDEVNRIVDRLEEQGYLNDERYCEEQIASLKNALAGKDKIVRTLQKKGISYDLISRCMEGKSDDEADNAAKYAQKLLNSHKNDSVQKTKNYIRSHLITQGYASGIASDVVGKLDFTGNESHELDNLRKCASKARKRYERKYSSYELRNRVFRYCAAQGYHAEDIYAIMDEMEWKNDDED